MHTLPPTGLFEPKPTPSAAENLPSDTPQPSTVVEQVQARTTPPPIPADRVTDYGRYTLLKEHAQGGLGKVSLARDTKLGRTVALKEIRPDRRPDAEALQRFVNEAAITGLLEHPGIVPIYSLDEDEHGKPYYAMRFIEGKSLQRAIEAYHASPDPAAFRKLLNHFIAVCNAVGFAHSKGVIHRDLKPENVMLGDYGETLVVDWGLAKGMATANARPLPLAEAPRFASLTVPETDTPAALPPDTPDFRCDRVLNDMPLTAAGRIMGTPAYMSPEQARGEIDILGPPTDIYALGGILYALLTGHPPFSGNVFDILQKVQQNIAPPYPITVQKEVPKALAAICVKAMAPRAMDRYPSAKELATEVERWLADEPTTAYVEPWNLRARRWVKKRRTLVTSTVGMLIVAVVSLSIALINLEASWEKERLTKEQERQAKLAARRAVRTLASNEQLEVLTRQDKLTPEQVQQLRALADFYRTCALEAAVTLEEQQRQRDDYFQLGQILRHLQQDEEADKAYGYAVDKGRQLIAAHPQNVDYQADLGAILGSLALKHFSFNRFVEAERCYLEARQLQERATAVPNPNPKYLADLAKTWGSLGNVNKGLGRGPESEACHLQALRLFEKLVAAHPDASGCQHDLAACWHNLGAIRLDMKQYAAAEKCFQESLTRTNALAEANPTDLTLPASLARTWTSLGVLQKNQNRLREAAASHENALRVRRLLVAVYPSSPYFQAEFGHTLANLGILASENKQPAQAEGYYEQARQVYEKLVAMPTPNEAYRADLAQMWHNLGMVQRTQGKTVQAEASYQQARRLREQLLASQPANEQLAASLGQTCHNLGILYKVMGKAEQAMASYQQARQVREPLARAQPTVGKPAADLAYSWQNLAVLQAEAKQFQAAQASFEQARQWREKLVSVHPEHAEYAVELSYTYGHMGHLAGNQRQYEAALRWYEQSDQVIHAVLARNPRHQNARTCLASSSACRAEIYALLGRNAEAVQQCEQALAFDSGTRRAEFLHFRQQFLGYALRQADVLARAGWHPWAASSANMLAPLSNLPANTWPQLARVFSLCADSQGAWFLASPTAAEREKFAAQAVVLLHRGRVKGFFASTAQVAGWRTDSDFAPLHARTDFRQLLGLSPH